MWLLICIKIRKDELTSILFSKLSSGITETKLTDARLEKYIKNSWSGLDMEKLTEEYVIAEVVITNIWQEVRCRKGKRELHLPHYPALSSYTAKTLYRK